MTVSSKSSDLASMEDEIEPYLIRISVLGDTMTGKSSLISRFLTDRMSMHYTATGSLRIHQKSIQYSDSQTCVMEFWDVPGQCLFSPFISNVVQQADAVVLVYDVTQPCTLKALDRWMTFMDTTPTLHSNSIADSENDPGLSRGAMKKYQPQRRHPPVIILGNKGISRLDIYLYTA
ncbi:RAB7, member RAS oncoprotein -like 1 [Coelomomyces lativittatus]|nr:RAB7, member RAS oncoprotein -like 1 [Coelomomyces lativittatus]